MRADLMVADELSTTGTCCMDWVEVNGIGSTEKAAWLIGGISKLTENCSPGLESIRR